MRVLLTGGTLFDGTGAPGRTGDLLIEDDRISDGKSGPLAPDEVIDAAGLVIAPGFIDMHSHGDFSLPGDGAAPAKILQGVTTEVVGNCGLGLYPANPKVDALYDRIAPLIFGEAGSRCSPSLSHYRARLESTGVSVNVAPLIPHGNVRCAVMGMAEGDATPSEISQMREWAEQGMAEGAFGISTGLVYPPGAYASTDELVSVVEPVARAGGFYATHMRNEGSRLFESVTEAIAIGERARMPVQISHHKAAGNFNWGRVKDTLALIDAANARGMDVNSDVYPYTAGSTVLSTMFIPQWAFEGSSGELIARIQDPATRKRIIADGKAALLTFVDLPGVLSFIPKRWLWPIILKKFGEAVIISSVKRQKHYEGRTIGSIAKERKRDLWEAMLDLLVEEDTAVAAIAHAMCEEDVQSVLKHPRTMVGTDGFPLREGKPHPRTFGTYPRVLENYVARLGLLTMEEAIFRMTGMVAKKLGLKDRGTLAPGSAADVVVFDPKKIHDRATYETPNLSPDGMAHVFVNGQWTVRDGKHVGKKAGRVLSRGQ